MTVSFGEIGQYSNQPFRAAQRSGSMRNKYFMIIQVMKLSQYFFVLLYLIILNN